MKIGYVCILPSAEDPRYATHITWGNQAKGITARWTTTDAGIGVDAMKVEAQLWDMVRRVAPHVFREAQVRGWIRIIVVES